MTLQHAVRTALMLAVLALAAPASALRELGSLQLVTRADVEDVAVVGDLVYVLTSRFNGGLRVIDVSDPTAPVEVAFEPDLAGTEIEIAGNLAYVAGGDLKIADISDPAAPVLLGSASLSGGGVYLAVGGQRAYVSDRRRNLSIVDVSDPALPVEVGTFAIPPGGGSFQFYDVAADASLAYLALSGPGAGTGFVVVDASDPSTPVEIGRSLPFRFTGGDPDPRIEVEGGRAYLTGGRTGEFAIVDVSDPAVPLELSLLPLERPTALPFSTAAADLEVDGSHAYLAISTSVTTSGMIVLDVSDPAAPVIRGTLGATNRAAAIAVAAGRAYLLGAGKTLQIIDLGNVEKPEILGAALTGAFFSVAIALDGDLAHVLSDAGELLLYDVSEARAPARLGSLNLEPRIRFPAIEAAGGWVYAGTGDFFGGPARVHIVDASSPAEPVAVALLELAPRGLATDLEVVGSLLYALSAEQGSFLRIFDVSDPASPIDLASLELSFPSGFADAIEIVDGLAYIAANSDFRRGELLILDVANPAGVQELARLPLDGELARVSDLAVADGFAYVVSDPLSGVPSLWAIDVRNPAQPLPVTRLDAQFSSGTIRVVDGRAYLAGSDRADVFDVSDPAAPEFLGGVGFARDLRVRDGLVYAVNPGALTIIDFGPEFAPNAPPQADAGPDQRLECAGPEGARIDLDGRGSHDPDGDPLTFTWTGPFGSAAGPTPTVEVPVGEHSVSLEVTDPTGASATDEMVVRVEDTRAPSAWASFEQLRGPAEQGRRGLRFRAEFACADVCDPAPRRDAEVDGEPVEDGEIVVFHGAGRPFDRTLELVCEDAVGHRARARAEPEVGAGAEDRDEAEPGRGRGGR